MADRLLRAGALALATATAIYRAAIQYGYVQGWQDANREQERLQRRVDRTLRATPSKPARPQASPGGRASG